MESLVKSTNRVIDSGEVYTPENIVNDMLDLLDKELILSIKLFDNSCGNGNFLLGFIKLKNNSLPRPLDSDKLYYNVLYNLSNIYGIDIQQDNIIEARERMYEYISNLSNKLYEYIECYGENKEINKLKDIFLIKSKEIINNNILLGDSLKNIIYIDNEEKPLVLYSYEIDESLNYNKTEFSLI